MKTKLNKGIWIGIALFAIVGVVFAIALIGGWGSKTVQPTAGDTNDVMSAITLQNVLNPTADTNAVVESSE